MKILWYEFERTKQQQKKSHQDRARERAKRKSFSDLHSVKRHATPFYIRFYVLNFYFLLFFSYSRYGKRFFSFSVKWNEEREEPSSLAAHSHRRTARFFEGKSRAFCSLLQHTQHGSCYTHARCLDIFIFFFLSLFFGILVILHIWSVIVACDELKHDSSECDLNNFAELK